MIRRKIITIDAAACNGCGLCAEACHEGAIVMRNGKAELLRDDYCDGLGDCLPACPAGAISFEEREALPYDEAAVRANMKAKAGLKGQPTAGGCPGMKVQTLTPVAPRRAEPAAPSVSPSCLGQWPVQLRLVPVNAAFFNGADLLVAADCSAFAHGSFHEAFMRGKVTVIACPKLDAFDNAAKLAEILRTNDVKSVTVVRMSVPCCGGLEQAVRRALAESGKDAPLRVAILGTDGSAVGDTAHS